MIYDGHQNFTCEHCGVEHRVPYKDFPMRDKGANACLSCGKQLHRWNGSRDYFEPELLKPK